MLKHRREIYYIEVRSHFNDYVGQEIVILHCFQRTRKQLKCRNKKKRQHASLTKKYVEARFRTLIGKECNVCKGAQCNYEISINSWLTEIDEYEQLHKYNMNATFSIIDGLGTPSIRFLPT